MAARRTTGRVINLDAARKARQEAAGEPVSLTFDGSDYTLPVELPADFVLCVTENDLRGAVRSLLGEGDAAKFFAKASMDDLRALVDGASSVYGLGEGESPASATS